MKQAQLKLQSRINGEVRPSLLHLANDQAATLANSPVHPPSGPSAQTLVVATASNNCWEGTYSGVATLLGDRNISSRRSSTTSSNDRAATLANSSPHPPSVSIDQTGHRNTASNIPGGGTNSQGSR